MPQKNKLYEFLISYRRVILFLFIFSGIMSFLSIVPSLYMFQIYDSVLTSRNVNTLLMLTLIAVFMYALFGFLDWSRSQILVAFSNDIDLRLKDRVFQCGAEQDYRIRLDLAITVLRGPDHSQAIPRRKWSLCIPGPALDAHICRHYLPYPSSSRHILHRKRHSSPLFGFAERGFNKKTTQRIQQALPVR